MKKFLLLLLLMASVSNAYAAISGRRIPIGALHNPVALFSSTTFLPTVIIYDQEVKIDSEEGLVLLAQEAYGDFEKTPIAEAYAKIFNVEKNDVLDSVQNIFEEGKEVTLENLVLEVK